MTWNDQPDRGEEAKERGAAALSAAHRLEHPGHPAPEWSPPPDGAGSDQGPGDQRHRQQAGPPAPARSPGGREVRRWGQPALTEPALTEPSERAGRLRFRRSAGSAPRAPSYRMMAPFQAGGDC